VIRNTGYADLTLSPLYLNPAVAEFGLETNCTSGLKPTLACEANVMFFPGREGTFSTDLIVESNDPDESPFVVPITGEGTIGDGGGGGPIIIPGG